MNSLIASESRMGIVPPLLIDDMSIARLVGPENNKVHKFTAQKIHNRREYG